MNAGKFVYRLIGLGIVASVLLGACSPSAGLSSGGESSAASAAEASPLFARLNLNTATAQEFLTIPIIGERMVREFMEYRPYVSIEQFRREIGKYVSADEVAAYENYIYVPIAVNEADASTLMQIAGLDEAEAVELIGARPFKSNEAFLSTLAAYASPDQVAAAGTLLETQ